MAPELLIATAETIARAADLIRNGKLVAFPTETVYGLGADATNDRAVASIFEAKGRPTFNPLIVHVSGHEEAARHARFTPQADALARAFWPGGITLVLPRRETTPISLLVSAGLDTVALRVPAHPIAQKLIHAAGRPIAAPSANASGEVSPTRAEHVAASLGHSALLAMILDGGACPLGLESTVIGFPENGTPTLLRPGAVPREDIERVLGSPLAAADVASGETGRSSPGQLASHYAPHAPLRLDADDVRDGELLLGFGSSGAAALNLSPSGDLGEAAANLFAMLRALDARADGSTIAVARIPERGLGEAINDRLRRAAAPRS
ncbi:L-threonylcarbamoyladenylate synthase [Parvibaculum sp.]|uniref:L-threonylcarbamoyladenylate synthase n=1 Tax=Parvibaculum sp. TaxID=2024848 RepID=UPI002B6D8406|nr:L-threonylcarbamoyladenylate synthase [Parvibaculum sp.]HUD50753.1 L-threonylcarbamoyladenylate synthase [Parvibaculum sp.]